LSSVYDLMLESRDLVDSYEEVISRVKLLKLEVVLEPSRVNTIISELKKLLEKTSVFLEKYSKASFHEEDYYVKYLRVYHDYLLLVSVPYLRDLLDDVARKLGQERYLLDEILSGLNSIIEKYSSTLNYSDKPSPEMP